jgi:prophage regulatory protein
MSSVCDDRLISGRDADAICGTSRSARYRFLAEGKFPKPVKIGTATRFSERECHAWVAARIADRDAGGSK